MKNIMPALLLSRQFSIFILGGMLSALIDIGTMILLLSLNSGVFIATTLGFFGGVGVNYLYHAKMTFKVEKSLKTLIRFTVIFALNYGLTIAFVFVAESINSSAIAGKLISLPLVAINGFILSKYWAFR